MNLYSLRTSTWGHFFIVLVGALVTALFASVTIASPIHFDEETLVVADNATTITTLEAANTPWISEVILSDEISVSNSTFNSYGAGLTTFNPLVETNAETRWFVDAGGLIVMNDMSYVLARGLFGQNSTVGSLAGAVMDPPVDHDSVLSASLASSVLSPSVLQHAVDDAETRWYVDAGGRLLGNDDTAGFTNNAADYFDSADTGSLQSWTSTNSVNDRPAIKMIC